VSDKTKNAQRAAQQTGDVEPCDVFHDAATEVQHVTACSHEAGTQHEVAWRTSVPASRTAEARGNNATNGGVATK